MTAIDLTVTYRDFYRATAVPAIVTVTDRPFLMIDGHGDPNHGTAYPNAVAAIYPLAYAIRAAIKERTGDAYKVMPLEGLWWADDMARFTMDDKSNWHWTAMISLPDDAGPELADILETTTRSKHLDAGHLARIDRYGDGLAAQLLHLGPYAEEPPTIAKLHAWIGEHGYRLTGLHHEIYLSDPRKGDPAKTRTIIRQPITRP